MSPPPSQTGAGPSAADAFVARRIRGALAGLSAGLVLVLLEAATRWAPALAGTDIAPDLAPPLAAAVLAGGLGALAGLIHPAAAAIVLLIAAPLGSQEPAVSAALALLAGAFALAVARRPWLSAPAGLGLAGLLLVVRPPAPDPAPRSADSPPDIVLLVLDTVGAEPTGLHGDPLDTTPVLSALAREATWFSRAIAPAPWTVPSHASMFTGRLPVDAGTHHEHPSLPAEVPTAATTLADAGYRTGAFLANPWVGEFNGLTRGFQHQEAEWQRGRANRAFSLLGHVPGQPSKGGSRVVAQALDWLDREAPGPRFAFLNILEAHSPFAATPDAGRYLPDLDDAAIAELSDRTHTVQMAGPGAVPDYPRPGELEAIGRLYRAGIHHVDHLVGELVAGLKAQGRWEDTVLIVTSDHGEAFGEHGFHGHMIGLYGETLHVPLVVRAPGRDPARVAHAVSLARLHPTLLDLAGLPPADDAQAVGPALPLGGHPDPAAGAPVISSQLRPLQVVADMRRARAAEGADAGALAEELGALDHRATRAEADGWAVLRKEAAEGGAISWELYDLAGDPGETTNRWADRGGLTEAGPLVEQLVAAAEAAARWEGADRGAGPTIDSDLRAELEALGYLAEE